MLGDSALALTRGFGAAELRLLRVPAAARSLLWSCCDGTPACVSSLAPEGGRTEEAEAPVVHGVFAG